MPDEMIIRHCAPTLAGMKTGNMFTYHFKDSSELRKTMRRLNTLFRGKGIRVLPLRYQKNCALIYLYRPSKLSKDLENDVARTILTECGYCVNSPKMFDSKFNCKTKFLWIFLMKSDCFWDILRKMFWDLFKIKPAVTNV